ncbi:MAG: patatin-like phospholipase family protein [Proteobacteria bacterium]|nr:patatin-like phospholipase family protein [Pseudomonadota bacterium]
MSDPTEPPPKAARPEFERIALLLQGGGALGAYQGGVYEALAEANLHPDWVAGISIGAINSAIIAGNPPERRVERLRAFWETVTQPPLGIPYIASLDIKNDMAHQMINQWRAVGALLYGAPDFFKPRVPPPIFAPVSSPGALSFYDVSPLESLLGRLVDFDLLNSGATRISVGATHIKTGNFVYFDSTNQKIAPAHIIASGSLPPGFPATEIDGEHYWDGGVVSNTPLQWVFDERPRRDTLAFQIDLWSARGELPRDMIEVDVRLKDIRYSSRTRMGTDQFRKSQALRRAVAKLLGDLPEALRQTPEAAALAREADDKVYNIIHLIYHAKSYEGSSKDYEFSRRTMEEHWKTGYSDMVRTLRYPEVLQRPRSLDGVFTFDLAQQQPR